MPQHTLGNKPQQAPHQYYQHPRGAKTLYHNGNAGRHHYNNSYEVSPSSFRYYSSSVEYLAGIIGADAATHVMFVLLPCYL